MASSALLNALLLIALGVLASAVHNSNDADASGSGSGDIDMSSYQGCLASGTHRGKRSHGSEEQGRRPGHGYGRGRGRQEEFNFPANGMAMDERERCCMLGMSLPDSRGLDRAMLSWKRKVRAGLGKGRRMRFRERLECMERAYCCCANDGKSMCGSLESVFRGGRE